MDENKIKHLEMIQIIITRMANNSFLLKGWSISIVLGFIAITKFNDLDYKLIALALITTIIFWILDGFFIRQERLFIKHYDYVRLLDNKDVDFSMKVSPYKEEIPNWFCTLILRTIGLFYLPLIAAISTFLVVSIVSC